MSVIEQNKGVSFPLTDEPGVVKLSDDCRVIVGKFRKGMSARLMLASGISDPGNINPVQETLLTEWMVRLVVRDVIGTDAEGQKFTVSRVLDPHLGQVLDMETYLKLCDINATAPVLIANEANRGVYIAETDEKKS